MESLKRKEFIRDVQKITSTYNEGQSSRTLLPHLFMALVMSILQRLKILEQQSAVHLLTPPSNITPGSHIHVMRIKEMITNLRSS